MATTPWDLKKTLAPSALLIIFSAAAGATSSDALRTQHCSVYPNDPSCARVVPFDAPSVKLSDALENTVNLPLGALPGTAPAPAPKPDAVPVSPKPGEEQKDALIHFGELLMKCDPQGKKCVPQEGLAKVIAGRIVEWWWGEANNQPGRYFVADKIKQDAGIKKGVEGQLEKMLDAALKNEAGRAIDPAGVIKIYYVLGPGQNTPGWLLEAIGKTDERTQKIILDQPSTREIGGAARVKMFTDCMTRWSNITEDTCYKKADPNAGLKTRYGALGEKPIDDLPAITVGFLKDAAEEAEKVISGARIKKSEVKAAIEKSKDQGRTTVPGESFQPNSNQGQNAAAGGPSQRAGDANCDSGKQYCAGDLYGGKGDEDVLCHHYQNGSRERCLSVRLVTVWCDGKGNPDPKGKMQCHRIAVYDITNISAGEVFGHTFPLEGSTDCIPLKDADPKNDKPQRCWKIGVKGGVVEILGDDDRPATNGKGPLTVARLKQIRMERAVQNGDIVPDDPKEKDAAQYYVVPQAAGGFGCYQFLPKRSVDEGIYSDPEMVCCVVQRVAGEDKADPSGRVKAGGYVDNNGEVTNPHVCQWSSAAGKWQLQRGPWPKDAEGDKGKGDKGTTSGPSAKNTKTGDTDKETKGKENEWPEDMHLTDGSSYSADNNLNDKLSSDLREKVHLYVNNDKTVPPTKRWIIVFGKAEKKIGQLLWWPGAETSSSDPQILDGQFIQTIADGREVYSEIQPDKNRVEKIGHFDPKGDSKSGVGPSFMSKDIDLLKGFLDGGTNLSSKDKEDILGWVKKVQTEGVSDPEIFGKTIAKEEDVTVVGGLKKQSSGDRIDVRSVVLRLEHDKLLLYPKLSGDPDDIKQFENRAGGSGAMVFESTPLSLTDLKGLPQTEKTHDEDGKEIAADRQKQPHNSDAAIYLGDAKLYFEFLATLKDVKDQKGNAKKLRSKLVYVFGGKDRLTPPKAGLNISGLDVSGPDIPVSVKLEQIKDYQDLSSSDASEKGAIAVYNAPGGERRECLGIVMWWGVSKDEAFAKCKK